MSGRKKAEPLRRIPVARRDEEVEQERTRVGCPIFLFLLLSVDLRAETKQSHPISDMVTDITVARKEKEAEVKRKREMGDQISFRSRSSSFF